MAKPPTIDPSIALALASDRIAAERGISRSDVRREADEAHVRVRGPSRLADRVADLIGVLDGPSNLSTNPAYLEDFGS